MPRQSVFARIANRRTERELATRVERAFRPDPAAIARVRAQLFAQVPSPAPVTAASAPRSARRVGFLAWRAMPVAIMLAIAVVGGLAVAGLRSGAIRSPFATGPGSPVTPSAAAAGYAVDLNRSDSSLQSILTAARTGDSAGLAAVLVTYQADLAGVEADLRSPGIDLVAAASRLRSEASDLASIANVVPAQNAKLFGQVTSDLNRIIASLPGNGGHPGPTQPPASTHQPGLNAKGNGNANANGNGNANGNANGNGKANGKANGNGNGNTNANANGHAKPH
jgi:hypothetical protein